MPTATATPPTASPPEATPDPGAPPAPGRRIPPPAAGTAPAPPAAGLPATGAGPAPAAVSAPAPRGRSTAPAGPAGRRPGPARPGRAGLPERHATSGRGLTAGSRAPSVGDLARAFARLYLEVECGRRSASQLAPLMDPMLHARLKSCWVRLHQPLASIRSVHVMVSSRRHVDAVAVVQRGRRAGVLALRLTRHGARWRVTEAARPEDGPRPPVPPPMPPARHTGECGGAGPDQPHERYLASARGRG